jgi:hypothetical protein
MLPKCEQLERFKKQRHRCFPGNVFGETPNTAGEDARAPKSPTLERLQVSKTGVMGFAM